MGRWLAHRGPAHSKCHHRRQTRSYPFSDTAAFERMRRPREHILVVLSLFKRGY